jgi:hypothetical protein
MKEVNADRQRTMWNGIAHIYGIFYNAKVVKVERKTNLFVFAETHPVLCKVYQPHLEWNDMNQKTLILAFYCAGSISCPVSGRNLNIKIRGIDNACPQGVSGGFLNIIHV